MALCECRQAALDAKVEWIKTLDTLNVKPEDMKKFLDYREMLDAMGDRLDAVIVCTPDHNHAIIGMDAMKRGKHIFIEKPMAYSIHEAIALREAARKYRVASQMGNEGHSWHVTPLAVEYLQSGAIGPVREVYHWCVGRSIGGDDTGMRAEPMKFISEHHKLWSVPLPEEEACVTYVGGTDHRPPGKAGMGLARRPQVRQRQPGRLGPAHHGRGLLGPEDRRGADVQDRNAVAALRRRHAALQDRGL